MDLGVNSMKAVELKMTFERELGLSLSSSILFDCPTIESLAAFLVEQMDAAGQAQTRRGPGPDPMVTVAAAAQRATVSADRAARSVAELLAEELADLRAQREPCS
jgi:hypothetical protein